MPDAFVFHAIVAVAEAAFDPGGILSGRITKLDPEFDFVPS